MSRDFEIRHPCPHRVRGEWVSIDPDLRTIRPLEIPSSSAVVLKCNGVEIPRNGLRSPARTRSSLTGPFEIQAGENDEFSLSVDGGSVQTAKLPPGPSVSRQTIARRMRAELDGVEVDVDDRGILIRTLESGRTSRIFLEGGSAHDTLGFPDRRHYDGELVFPGWNLVKRPGTVIPQDRVIKLDRPAAADDNIYELNYQTRQEDCRRCQGLGVENDFRYDENGEPITVENAELLLQEVQKITFTIRGSNIFHRWYGTSLVDMIGDKIGPTGDIVESQMAAEISEALERWREVKRKQSAVQEVTPEEQLSEVTELRVEQDPDDPTVFDVFVAVRSRAGQTRRTSSQVITTNRRDDFELIA